MYKKKELIFMNTKKKISLLFFSLVALILASCPNPASSDNPEKPEAEVIAKEKPIFFASSSENGLSRMTTTGTDVERILPWSYHPDVSPDGTKITYHAGDGYWDNLNQQWISLDDEIWIADIDGSNRVKVTDNDSRDYDPCFSPDGSKILFITDRNGNYDLCTADYDGQNQTIITSSQYPECFAEYSPDGTKITYTYQQGSYSTIVLCDADGSNPVDLLQDPNQSTWAWGGHFAPDGKSILYTIWNENGQGMHTLNSVNTDGTNNHLVYSQMDGRDGVYSPDGSKIAFEGNINGYWQIFTVNIDGTGIRQLTNEPNSCFHPNWIWPDAYSPNAPPAEVNYLTPIRGDQQVTLYWSNPASFDFNHVEIFYGSGNTDTQLPQTSIIDSINPNVTHEATITGLTNGVEYTFIVKTVDNKGIKSDGEVVFSTPLIDNTAPSVASMTPADSATNIATDTPELRLQFDEPMLQRGYSYNSDLVSISTGAWQDEYTYVLTFSEELQPGYEYHIVLNPSSDNPGFMDLSGNFLAINTDLSFTTEALQTGLPTELLGTWYEKGSNLTIANNNIAMTRHSITTDYPIAEVNLNESYFILNFIEYGMYSKVEWQITNDELLLTFYEFNNSIDLARDETTLEYEQVYYSYFIPANDGLYEEADNSSLSGSITIIDEMPLSDITVIELILENETGSEDYELYYHIEAPTTRTFTYDFINLPPGLEWELDVDMYLTGYSNNFQLGDLENIIIDTGDNTADVTIPLCTQDEIDCVQGTRYMWFAERVGLLKLQYIHNDGTTTDIELSDYTLTNSGDFYPLLAGNQWTYERTNPAYLSTPVIETWECQYDSFEDEFIIECHSSNADGEFEIDFNSEYFGCNSSSSSGTYYEPMMYLSFDFMKGPDPILEYDFSVGHNWTGGIQRHGSFYGFGKSTIESITDSVTTDAGTFDNVIRVKTDIDWDVQ